MLLYHKPERMRTGIMELDFMTTLFTDLVTKIKLTLLPGGNVLLPYSREAVQSSYSVPRILSGWYSSSLWGVTTFDSDMITISFTQYIVR